ncbi:DUF4174 domain-containing protein [Sphingomonas sp. DC1600-2]|uniref:DUF4174 domain-containing protein n=1 Tax=unclassified Sphingomonas TaxID=196159 RepID=UPI003CEF4385
MLLAALALMTQSVVEMRHHHRLLVIAAPAETDRQAQQQIAALAASQEPLAARDVVIVTVMADRVAGVRDSAAALRQLWSLPRDRFTVLLIGKDGHVALRQTDPITPATLIAAIDAMPMRRAGLR